MEKITWEQFEAVNENKTSSFENMCRLLFNRQFFDNKKNLISKPNHPGVEVYPVFEEKSGKWISFQSKFFSNNTDYAQIKKSVEKTIKHYSDSLDVFYLYCNKDLNSDSRSYKEIEDEFFAKETGISSEFRLGVFSSSKSYEEALAKNNPRGFLALVEKDWIDKYHDFPTLFNNLQHLYGFFSSQVISLLPSFPNIEMGVFSRTLGIKPTRYYEAAETFRTKNYLAMMKLEVFRQAISDYGIRIEDMIAWFFSDYCQETFDIKWLSLDFPSNGETITNRTKVLFTLEEEIRKQYQLLIEDGEIESELYNFIKNTPNIANLPSLVKNKSAYITDDPKAKNILKLLFSDQAGMGYINEELKEENLVNLLLKHEVKVPNFHKFQQVNLKVLQEKGL